METLTRLDDRYRLLRIIGHGSEGRVHLAIQESTNKVLAVKEIRKDGACYSREGVEVWKRLYHPNLPEVIDLIETEETVWVVMEYVEGMHLSSWISENGYPHAALLYQWLLVLCDTLEYLHGQEPPVIFGDLKPENIMIQKRSPVLIDLGSAYVKGSKTKKTGSYLAKGEKCEQEFQKDLFCLGKTVEEILPKKTSAFHIFARKAMGIGKDPFQDIKDCRKYLKRLQLLFVVKLLLWILGGGLLLAGCMQLVREREKEDVLDSYQIYSQKLEEMLEDAIFDAQEYQLLLTMWGKVEENTRTSGENLKQNLSAYSDICYKVGLACWYCTEEWGGDTFSARWFEEVAGLPGELRRQSESYLKLYKWKEQLDFKSMTEEKDEHFFRKYYEETEKLQESGEEFFRLLGLKEEGLFLIHYMAELKEEGMERIAIERYIEEGKNAIKGTKDQRKKTDTVRRELDELISVVEKDMERIYERKTDEKT